MFIEFDEAFTNPETYTPPTDDPLLKALENCEIEEFLRKNGQSVTVERFKHYQMEKAILGEGFTSAPAKQDSVPHGEEFYLAVQKAAKRLMPGEIGHLFDGAIRVQKVADGSATWQRVKQ